MSYTNSTAHYNLPQYVDTDKPTYLHDFNDAMETIDNAIAASKTAADNAQTTANTATQTGSDNAETIATLTKTVADNKTATDAAVAEVKSDTDANTGSINTINSLIGNGQPTTQDKTIIGAINEINAKQVDVPDVSSVICPVVEDTTTAIAAHAVGSYLSLDDKLYVVTAAIAVGDTIAVGTNVTETTVTGELINIDKAVEVNENAIESNTQSIQSNKDSINELTEKVTSNMADIATINSNRILSTEEKIWGEAPDGSTLYCKTYTLSGTFSESQTVDTSITSNTAILYGCDLFCWRESTIGTYYAYSRNDTNGSTGYAVGPEINRTGVAISIGNMTITYCTARFIYSKIS